MFFKVPVVSSIRKEGISSVSVPGRYVEISSLSAMTVFPIDFLYAMNVHTNKYNFRIR